MSDKFTMHHGDCLGILRSMPTHSVDAVITDPPYCSGSVSESSRTASNGQGLRSDNLARFGWFVGDNMGTAGLVFLLRSIAFESLRVMRPNGSLLMFCDWRMLPNLAPAIESTGFRYQNMVVWDKGAMGLGTGFRAQHELVMHFTSGKPEYFNKGTGNVIQSRRVHHTEREHQTQKPVDLMAQLIEVACRPGGVVLDPFCGSGSTGVAALGAGRRFVGIERDAGYMSIAQERLARAAGEASPDQIAQLNIFTPAVHIDGAPQ